MNSLSVLIALLAIPAAGLWPAALFMRRRDAISSVELLLLSWLLGVSLVSIALACGGIFMRGFVLQMTVTTGCVLFGCLGIRLCRVNQSKITWPKPDNKIEGLFCAVLLAGFVSVALIQFKTALFWDGLAVWEIKARYAFLNGGSIPAAYFSDSSRLWSHPEYPLMLPMLETWIYLWIGDCHQFWVRAIFPVFYYAAALVLYAGVTHLSGKKWAGLTAAFLLFLLPHPMNGLVFAGYADLPLSVFYLAGLVCFFRYQIEPSSAQLGLVSVLAGMMPWIKREGLLLWLCLMFIAVIELLRTRKYLASAMVLLPGLIAWLGWKTAMTLLATGSGSDFLPCSLEILGRNFFRVTVAMRMLGKELVNPGHWSLLWMLFPVALICLAAGGRRKIALQLLFCVAAPLILVAGAFIFSSWAIFQNHISTSLPRLVLQIAPAGILAIGMAVGRNEKL